MHDLGPTSPTGGGLRKQRRRPFLHIPSETVRDRTLSFRARGVLAWLLDQPDGWDVRAAVIAGHGTEGRDAIEAALRELRAAGYYRLERRRLPGGSFVMGTAVAEEAQPAWAASHLRHDGRAVPVVVDLTGTVTELDPPAPVTDSQGPADQGPGTPAPVDPSPASPSHTQTDTQTETQRGTLVGDVTRGQVPDAVTPPSRTCHKWPTPHGTCGACAIDREALTAYEADLTAADRAAAARLAAADRAAQREARLLGDGAANACELCDLDGIAELIVDGEYATTLCTHTDTGNADRVRARRDARAAVPITTATASTRARKRAASTQTQEA